VEADEDQFAEDPFAAQPAQSGGDETFSDDMTLDLSETPDTIERPVIPPGIYDADLRDVEFTQSRANNPMLVWQYNVRDQEGNNHIIWNHTVLNDERGKARAKKAVRVLLQGDEDFDFQTFRPGSIAEWAVGRQCRVKVRVRNDPDYGRQNQINDVLPPADQGFLS
jgi:hypothetical protein